MQSFCDPSGPLSLRVSVIGMSAAGNGVCVDVTSLQIDTSKKAHCLYFMTNDLQTEDAVAVDMITLAAKQNDILVNFVFTWCFLSHSKPLDRENHLIFFICRPIPLFICTFAH